MKNLTVKQLAEQLNVTVEDAQSIKDVCEQMNLDIDQAIEILGIKIVERKERTRTDAPIHKVYDLLQQKLEEAKAKLGKDFKGSIEVNKPAIINRIFKQYAGYGYREFAQLEGAQKVQAFAQLKAKYELESFADVPKYLKKLQSKINRTFAVSGDNTAISTNHKYVDTMQIERTATGAYIVHTPESPEFARLKDVAGKAIQKRKDMIEKSKAKAKTETETETETEASQAEQANQ